jgi:hypothetical protein
MEHGKAVYTLGEGPELAGYSQRELPDDTLGNVPRCLGMPRELKGDLQAETV